MQSRTQSNRTREGIRSTALGHYVSYLSRAEGHARNGPDDVCSMDGIYNRSCGV